jgi:hypothetical protein
LDDIAGSVVRADARQFIGIDDLKNSFATTRVRELHHIATLSMIEDRALHWNGNHVGFRELSLGAKRDHRRTGHLPEIVANRFTRITPGPGETGPVRSFGPARSKAILQDFVSLCARRK